MNPRTIDEFVKLIPRVGEPHHIAFWHLGRFVNKNRYRDVRSLERHRDQIIQYNHKNNYKYTMEITDKESRHIAWVGLEYNPERAPIPASYEPIY